MALIAAIEDELADSSAGLVLGEGETFGLSAAGEKALEMAADAVDRKVDLTRRYLDTDDDMVRVRMMTELRLHEQAIAKLLKTIDTAPPVAESHATVKARHAADVRWNRERARGSNQG